MMILIKMYLLRLPIVICICLTLNKGINYFFTNNLIRIVVNLYSVECNLCLKSYFSPMIMSSVFISEIHLQILPTEKSDIVVMRFHNVKKFQKYNKSFTLINMITFL